MENTDDFRVKIMKLDRNTNPSGLGKYALVLLRKLHGLPSMMAHPITHERSFIVPEEAFDTGSMDDTKFFVIRLRDKYAGPALRAYARAATGDGNIEYANEILDLALIAERHPNKKRPD